MALLVTLVVLVILTVIVVTYATVVRLEISTARSSFELERARLLASTAIDEVLVKLKDGIPLDRPWAVAPGRLVAYSADGSWKFTDLHSGDAPHSPTGKVALNGDSLTSAGSRAILSPNAEFSTPDPMQVDWINVLRDGARSTDAAYAPSAANPIVGRYAYWVDIETAKVNLNTAGKAQTTYVIQANGTPSMDADIQNLSGHPSRVDLSQLEGITSAQSLATYNFTASSVWFGGVGSDNKLGATITNPPVRALGQGMKRFNSIDEWTRINGITPATVEADKFNLTTVARSPEITPWGLNQTWLQSTGGPQLPVPGTTSAAWRFNLLGNRLNLPDGLPFRSPPGFSDGLPDLRDWPGPGYSGSSAESRYFAYPAVVGKNVANFQHLGWFTSSSPISGDKTTEMQRWVENVMALLSRKDWPGLPAKSFVDKYGLEECEDLAVNLLYLFESSAGNAGFAPSRIFSLVPASGEDATGFYGSRLIQYTRPDGTIRRLPGIGAWPWLNEIGVSLSSTTKNAVGANTAARPKDAYGPGAPAAIATGDTAHINLVVKLNYELTYPASLAWTNDWRTGRVGCTALELTVTGKYNGVPITYGGSPASDYFWSYADDTTVPKRGIQRGMPSLPLSPSSSYPTDYLTQIFVGPFDRNTPVTVDFRFRTFTSQNATNPNRLLQLVPAVADTAGQLDDPATPTKFHFRFVDYPVDGTAPSTQQTLEVGDPRVSRYVSDWLPPKNGETDTLGLENTHYVASYADPLTGINGDASKFTWPNVGAASRFVNDPTNLPRDPRFYQNATCITGFPGIGWLSVLPTNVESGGTWSGGIRTAKAPVPWRTLSLEPATRANQLPDWLLLDVFAIAYEKTCLSQTEGKINVNARVEPFGFNRLAPLKSLLIPSAANPTTSANLIAADLAAATAATSGPADQLPSELYVYRGQICQVPRLAGSGANQFKREALMRDLAGLVTTQSSDFKVYVVAQSLAPNVVDPAQPGKVMAEQRAEALISRVVDVGPDGIPATADDLAGPDRAVGTTDDLQFKTATGGTVSSLKYDGTDTPLEGSTGRPPFRFQVSAFKSLNP